MEPTVQRAVVTRPMSGIDGCRQRLLLCVCVLVLRFGVTGAWRPLHTKQANNGNSGVVRSTCCRCYCPLLRLTLSGLRTVLSRRCGMAHAAEAALACTAQLSQLRPARRDLMTPAASRTSRAHIEVCTSLQTATSVPDEGRHSASSAACQYVC